MYIRHKMNALCLAFGLFILTTATQSIPKVVPARYQHRQVTEKALQVLSRRAYFDAALNNYMPLGYYFATVDIGTPPQTLELAVSTGSSDIWFFSPQACSNSGCEGGSYDSNQSSTYQLLGRDEFSIIYETPGSGIRGDYISDTFQVGGMMVNNLTMAVASQVNSSLTGFMGIGLRDDEANSANYPNLPEQLYSQGLVSSKSYSIYLDNHASSYGTIIFGGYDPMKYWNNLYMLPLQNSSYTGIVDNFRVAWTSFSVTYNGTVPETYYLTSSDFPLAVIIDSSTTLSYLPENLFTPLAQAFGATYDNNTGIYIVNCSATVSTTTINFGFGGSGGVIVPVPSSELTAPCYNEDGERCLKADATPLCWFGLQPSSPGRPFVFGQTFLRSAYVLYDLENLQLGLAPTVFESDQSAVVEYNPSGANNYITTYTAGPTITAYSSTPSGTVGVTSSTGAPFVWSSLPLDAAPAVQAMSLTALTEASSMTSAAAPATTSSSTTIPMTSSTASEQFITFGSLSSNTNAAATIPSTTTGPDATGAAASSTDTSTTTSTGAAAGLVVLKSTSILSVWLSLGSLVCMGAGVALVL